MSGSARTARPILLEVSPTNHQQLAAASRRTVLVDGAERLIAPQLRALLSFLCHGGLRCAIEWLPADAGLTEQRRAFSRAAVALTTLEHTARLAWMRPPSVAALLVPAAAIHGPPGSSGDIESPSPNVRVWWHATHRSAGIGGIDLVPGWNEFRSFARWLFRCEATRVALQTDSDRQAAVAAAERASRAAPGGAEAVFAEEASTVVAAVLQGEGSQPETRRRGELAVQMLQVKRAAQPATGDAELAEIKNLICVAQLAGLYHRTLILARELLRAPACSRAASSCFCSTAGIVVNLLRAGADPSLGASAAAHSGAAGSFFEAHVPSDRYPYTSPWQMPAPAHMFEPTFAASATATRTQQPQEGWYAAWERYPPP